MRSKSYRNMSHDSSVLILYLTTADKFLIINIDELLKGKRYRTGVANYLATSLIAICR